MRVRGARSGDKHRCGDRAHFRRRPPLDCREQQTNALPADFKEVVLLHYYQGFGIEEISEMLNVPMGTVSSRLSRARKKMEAQLKGDE